ncbi:hypothetical protein pb186bvf_017141 [Paramecium bursaria]
MNVIQCNKHNNQIIGVCMKCSQDQLICVKCSPNHKVHENYLIKLSDLETYLKTKQYKAKDEQIFQELNNSFNMFKSRILEKLDQINLMLKKSIADYQNNQLDELSNQLIQKQNLAKYEDFEQFIKQFNIVCQFDPNIKNFIIEGQKEKQKQLIFNFSSVISSLQQVSQALDIKTNEQTVSSIIMKQDNHVIKIFETLSRDLDGSPTLSKLSSTKMNVTYFNVLNSFDLKGVMIPSLYMDTDQVTFIISIHMDIDLRNNLYQHIQSSQSVQEKSNNCYVIKFSTPFKLFSNQQYSISVRIKEQSSITFTFVKKVPNDLISLILKKNSDFKKPPDIKDVQDYGGIASLLI